MMKYSNKNVARLYRLGKRINRRYKFWLFMCAVLKFGPYGFAISRLQKAVEDGQRYDREVKRCQREERRALAIRNKNWRHA